MTAVQIQMENMLMYKMILFNEMILFLSNVFPFMIFHYIYNSRDFCLHCGVSDICFKVFTVMSDVLI